MLAKIILKTIESGQINLTDHSPLFSVFESIAQSTRSFSFKSTVTDRRGDSTVNSLAKNDSIGTCHDSSSLPSSVHVIDVTHDSCLACELPTTHGVSITEDEPNVIERNVTSLPGTSGIVSITSSTSRKRPAVLSSDSIESSIRGKSRHRQEPGMEAGGISSFNSLSEYVNANNHTPSETTVAHDKIIRTDPGKWIVCSVQDDMCNYSSNALHFVSRFDDLCLSPH